MLKPANLSLNFRAQILSSFEPCHGGSGNEPVNCFKMFVAETWIASPWLNPCNAGEKNAFSAFAIIENRSNSNTHLFEPFRSFSVLYASKSHQLSVCCKRKTLLNDCTLLKSLASKRVKRCHFLQVKSLCSIAIAAFLLLIFTLFKL